MYAEASILGVSPSDATYQPLVDDASNETSPRANKLPELDVPPMRILIMVVGTAGDIMPLIDLAHRLQDRYGHVVRIASHDDLRAPVEKAGLRYFSITGSAQVMAGWGPSFSLVPLTLLKLALNPIDPFHRKIIVIRKIILHTIRACTEPDPDDENAEPFHADVIMSNVMTFGHIHCADALNVPLHFIFPNPWVATSEYPHSFSGWSFPTRPTPGRGLGYEWSRSPANFLSYRLVDMILQYTFLPFMNELRARCGLRTIRAGSMVGGPGVPYLDVPFSQMWSEALSTRPREWPEHVQIVRAHHSSGRPA